MADQTMIGNQMTVTICHAYQNRLKKECGEDCYGLHACRRWMGGSCRETDCPYGHTFLDEHNRRVISRRSQKVVEAKICDDRTRFTLRRLFAATCFFYNYSKRSCNAGSTCDRLHVCADYLMGSCNISPCPRSHKLLSHHSSAILYRFGLALAGQPEEYIRVNILTSQSPEFEKTCRCHECKKTNEEKINFFTLPSPTSEHDSDAAFEVDDGETSSSTSETTLEFSSFLNAIADAGGIETFDALVLKFGIEGSFDLVRWFDHQKRRLQSAVTIYPIQFAHGNQQVVTIQHCLRTCIAYNYLGTCSDTRCTYIHVCALFIADLCPSRSSSSTDDAVCTRHLSHTLEGDMCRTLGVTADKLKRLVRAAHPVVCERYNSPAGCPVSDNKPPACRKLHICNRMIVSTCKTCSLNHSFSNPMCSPLLHRLRVDTSSELTLRQTTLPCSISDAERATLYSTTPVTNCSPLSSSSINENIRLPSELPLVSRYQQINVRDVVLFCINNQSSPCFATYEELSQHFNVNSPFDWRAWCMYVRKPTAADYERMHYYYLHPIAFEWRKKWYLTVTNAFRLCGFHQDARCTSRNCQRLHICVRYVAGLCRDANCQLGHSTQVDNCSVFDYIGLSSWTTVRKTNLIRAAHPIVCARYAFDTCDAGTQCEQVHVCNQSLLRLCDSCSLSHSLRSQQVTEVLQRFGMLEINENTIRKLIIPVSNDAVGKEGKLERNQAAVASVSDQLNCIQEQPASSVSDKLISSGTKLECSSLQTQDTDDEQEPIRGGGVSKLMELQDDVDVIKEPYICERHLRDVCEFDDSECTYFHLDQPFCWLFKLPSQDCGIDTDETYKTRIPKVAIRKSEPQQKETWYLFRDLISEEIERCYVDPTKQTFTFFVNPDDDYPFAYTCELHFGTARDAAAFCLETRIKLSNGNFNEQTRTTLQKRPSGSTLAALPRQRFSKPQDRIAVRSVRTKSYAMLPAICLKATKWQWFYHARFKIETNGALKYLDNTEKSDTVWVDLRKLVGTSYVDELEYQFVNGNKSYNARTRIDKKRSINFEFDLQALLLRCFDETVEIETELISRPCLCRNN